IDVMRGEERADRAIAESGGEYLFRTWSPFALDEAAGELARGVRLLAVVDGQREEDASRDGRPFDGRDEHDGVAEAHQHGAMCLLRDLAGCETEGAVVEREFDAGGLH